MRNRDRVADSMTLTDKPGVLTEEQVEAFAREVWQVFRGDEDMLTIVRRIAAVGARAGMERAAGIADDCYHGPFRGPQDRAAPRVEAEDAEG